MLKRILILVLSFVFIVGLAQSSVVKAVAKTTVKATATPSATPVPVVDSFSLFWPMVAGKTMQSKIYFVKTLKEDVRGFFIFGSAQKADYNVFIGIKRMLEAEALIKGNVPDLANKTLDAAISDFDKANSSLTNAKNSSDIPKDVKDEINSRLGNLKMFTNSLIVTYPNYKNKLQSVLDKLNSIAI